MLKRKARPPLVLVYARCDPCCARGRFFGTTVKSTEWEKKVTKCPNCRKPLRELRRQATKP